MPLLSHWRITTPPTFNLAIKLSYLPKPISRVKRKEASKVKAINTAMARTKKVVKAIKEGVVTVVTARIKEKTTNTAT